MRRLFRLGCIAALIVPAACRKSAPEAPPAPSAAAPATIEVLKDGRWLFTYAEPKGTFATTDKPDSVPEDARALVRVFDPSTNGSRSLAFYREGGFFGELSILNGSPRAASAEAVTDCTLLALPPETVLDLRKQFPEFAKLLDERLAQYHRDGEARVPRQPLAVRKEGALNCTPGRVIPGRPFVDPAAVDRRCSG